MCEKEKMSEKSEKSPCN